MNKWQVWSLLVLCNLFWAGNYVVGKFVIAEISPLWITYLRWILALFLLFPLAIYLEKPDWAAVKKDIPLLIVMGIVGVVGFNTLLYMALAYTTPTNAALVSTLNPGVIVLLSVLVLREQVTAIQGAGLLVSLLGVLVILTQGELAQVFRRTYNTGDLLMLAALVAWAVYSLVGKKITIRPVTATAVSSLLAVIMITPFALMQGLDTTKIGPLAIAGTLYIAIFPSVGSFMFWNMAVRIIGAGKTGISLNLVPVFTMLIGISLGETITAAQIVGGFLVFIGVYLTTGLLDQKLAEYKGVETAK